MTDRTITKVIVPRKHGCRDCHYHSPESGVFVGACHHPDSRSRNCSPQGKQYEFIYLTEEKAALARLRGTYGKN